MSSSPASSLALDLPLQSDPPWLQGAVLSVSGLSIVAFMAMFAHARYPAALGALPGVTAARALGRP